MEDTVTILAVLLILSVAAFIAAMILLLESDCENERLRQEKDLFRRLWNEEMTMKNGCFNAYTEMFRKSEQAVKRTHWLNKDR